MKLRLAEEWFLNAVFFFTQVKLMDAFCTQYLHFLQFLLVVIVIGAVVNWAAVFFFLRFLFCCVLGVELFPLPLFCISPFITESHSSAGSTFSLSLLLLLVWKAGNPVEPFTAAVAGNKLHHYLC